MLKRIALIAAALAALSGMARAEGALCVVAPGVTALVDAAGAELIPNGACEDLFEVRPGALFAAGSRGDYRLYDAAGQPLGDERFAMICDAGDALLFRRGSLYGAMSASGEVLIDPIWTQLTPDGESGWLALDGDPLDERPDEMIHIDAAGEARRTGVYTASALAEVCGGRMPYMDPDGLYGAVDGQGGVAVQPRWRALGAFRKGLAVAWGPEGAGLIDAEGREVVAPRYRWLLRGEGLIAARSDGRLDVYAPDGSARRFSVPGEALEAGLVGDGLWVDDGERCLLYDADGALLAELPGGARLEPGTQGQFITVEGAWGEPCQSLLNPDGGRTSVGFQQLLPLCPGRYAYLEMDGIEYYSAELNRLQRSWDYSGMRYGLLDAGGAILLPARYREIRALGEDRLLLIGDDAVELADRDGGALKRWVIPEATAPTDEAASG